MPTDNFVSLEKTIELGKPTSEQYRLHPLGLDNNYKYVCIQITIRIDDGGSFLTWVYAQKARKSYSK